jgi:MarR family 2-MHQ and catechol resistance regulon transcriptional repressor
MWKPSPVSLKRVSLRRVRQEPAPADRSELAGLLVDLTALVSRRAVGHTLALMNEAGLTMGQMVALFILAHAGNQPMGALAQKVQLSPAAATHMIEQLVQGGLVSRLEVPEDRRSKRIQITGKGRAFIHRLDVERRSEFADAMSHLKPQTALRLAQAARAAVAELTQTETAGHRDPARKGRGNS